MCLGPLAYGHATATRIFLGAACGVTGANDRESFPSHPAGAETRSSDPEAGQERDTADERGPARADRAGRDTSPVVVVKHRARSFV